MKNKLDWSAYDSYGEGDAYAQIPAEGGAYGKAASLCIGSRQCQRTDIGVMCPSFRITHDDAHSTRHRAATLKAALNGEYGKNPFLAQLFGIQAQDGELHYQDWAKENYTCSALDQIPPSSQPIYGSRHLRDSYWNGKLFFRRCRNSHTCRWIFGRCARCRY